MLLRNPDKLSLRTLGMLTTSVVRSKYPVRKLHIPNVISENQEVSYLQVFTKTILSRISNTICEVVWRNTCVGSTLKG